MLKRSLFVLLSGSFAVISYAQELPVERVEEVLRLERYFVFNLGDRVNTEFSEYNPVLSPDGQYLLYTSRNDTTTGENIYSEDRQYFEDISLAQENQGNYAGIGSKDNPLGSFANKVNTRNHEAPVYISKDAQTIIMFKDNDLWFSERSGDGYTEPQRYPKNINFKYYHRHASLTADGNHMYFTSEVLDKKTGRFHLDLYRSSKDENGEWQKPEALSLPVNSLYNEDSPEISADGSMLFFSSDRPEGMGGYDIYYVNLLQDSLELIQLREPINSSGQDIYFKLLPEGESAYFSSDRLGGFGGMDLYKVAFYEERNADCTVGIERNTDLKIVSEDSLRAGSYLLANTGGSTILGQSPDFYDWYLNDSLVGKGRNLSLLLEEVGEYRLRAIMGVIDQGRLGYQVGCVDRTLQVLAPEQFESASTINLGVPAENQLLTEQELLDILPDPEGDLVVSNDVGSTYQGVPLQMNLLDNDPSAREEQIAIESIQQPRYGSVMIDQPVKGIVRYYPSKDFVGNDAFSYVVQSGSGAIGEAFVGVRVLVNPYLDEINEKEEGAKTVMDYAITSAGRLVSINVLLNDAFSDEDDVRLSSITSPANGAARIYDAVKGIIVYAPNRSFTGEEVFTYEVVSNGKPYKGKVKVAVGSEEEPLVAAVNTPEEEKDKALVAAAADGQQTDRAEAKREKIQQKRDEAMLDNVDLASIDTRSPPELALETIYFDFDKTYIRSDARAVMEKNVAILKENPDAVIKVVSHCDSWGSSTYNQLLSAQRAKSTVDYLVYKGIEKERIAAAVGFGEEELVNDCGDGVPCPKAKHQENRRSEFFVIGTFKKE
jgi:outer membrane protein OmpA-like peptidoglycan-associated protein